MKTTRETTPGFNSHMFIAFTYNKNAKKVAYYQASGFRWIRMSLGDALLFVAQGQATEVEMVSR